MNKTLSIMMLLLTLLVQMSAAAMSAGCGMQDGTQNNGMGHMDDGMKNHAMMAMDDTTHHHPSTDSSMADDHTHPDCCGSAHTNGHCNMSACLPLLILPSVTFDVATVATESMLSSDSTKPSAPTPSFFRPPIV